VTINNRKTATGIQDLLFFNALLNHGQETINKPDSHQPSQSREFIFVNRTLLLHNLIKSSLRLGSGLGYAPTAVHNALQDSVVEETQPVSNSK